MCRKDFFTKNKGNDCHISIAGKKRTGKTNSRVKIHRQNYPHLTSRSQLFNIGIA